MATPPPPSTPTNMEPTATTGNRKLLFGIDLEQITLDLNLPATPEPSAPDHNHQTPTIMPNHYHHHYQLPQVLFDHQSATNYEATNMAVAGAVGPDHDGPEVDSPPNNVGLSLRCAICMDTVMREPMATKCGHVFCRMCIQIALGWRKRCPTCRVPIRGERAVFRLYP